MSAMGIGSFFGGLADGYAKGTRLNLEQEKADREKRQFEFEQQQRELDKIVKDETAKALTDLETRFRAPPPAPGAIKDPNAPAVEPMTEPEYYYERAKVIAGAGVKLGKFSLADEKALRESGREMKFDNFRDAVKHAYSNPDDVPGIQKKLKKAGIELPEGIRFQTVPMDPNDPQSDRDLVGFVMGKDGKPQKVFSYMDSVPMFAASEVLTQDALDTKKGLRGQRHQSREKDKDRQNAVLIQDMQNQGALASASAKNKDDPQKAGRDMLEGRVRAAFTNAAGAIDFDKTNLYTARVGALMEQLIAGNTKDGRKYGVYEAMNAALQHYAKEEPTLAKSIK